MATGKTSLDIWEANPVTIDNLTSVRDMKVRTLFEYVRTLGFTRAVPNVVP